MSKEKQDQTSNNINEILKYFKYWPWFVLSLICAISGSFFYLKYSNKVYVTNSKIQILDKSRGIELNATAYLINRSNINLENEVQLIKSYPIIENVVVENNLNVSFYEKKRFKISELFELPFKLNLLIKPDSIQTPKPYQIGITKTGYEILKPGNTEPKIIEGFDINKEHALPFTIQDKEQIKHLVGRTFILKLLPTELAVDKLKASITIKELGGLSNLLSLSLQGQNIQKSELILNALIESYKMDGIKSNQMVSKRTIEFVDDRLVDLFGELNTIEDNKKDFKQKNNFIGTQENASMTIQELSNSDATVLELSNKIFLANSLKDILVNSFKEISLLPADFGFNSNELNSLITNFNTKVFEYKKVKEGAGLGNPLLLSIKKQLEKIQDNLTNSLNLHITSLQYKKKQLNNKNQRIKNKMASLPLNEKVLRSIERQQQIKESLYLLLLQKREEAAINLSIAEPSVKVIEYARTKASAVFPKPFVFYSLSTLFGFLVPFVIIYVILTLDTKIRSVEYVENLLPEVPILAELSYSKSNENSKITDSNENTYQKEIFRILSSNLNFIIPKVAPNNAEVICCTSSVKGEGKTYISFNLALTLGSLKKRVLIIGADLRNPQIHNYVGTDKNHKGLTNYLYNNEENVSWKDLIISDIDGCFGCDVLLGGPIPPNAQALLVNGRFSKLIDEARLKYDYVIIDTAPTVLVSDTFLISHCVDVFLYVIRANYVDKKVMNHVVKLFETKKIHNLGLVINGLKKSNGNNNYGYGYGYS